MRRALLVVVPLGLVVLAVGLALFQPWKLWVDDRVDEAFPVTAGAEAGAGSSGPSPSAGRPARARPDVEVLARGAFSGHDHHARGTARAVELADGSRFLRIEDLDTSNGPDLFVYLSNADPSDGEGAIDDDFVNLGRLKGNVGDQNYEVPEGVDLSRYRTVAIWCRRFSSLFGTAPLTLS